MTFKAALDVSMLEIVTENPIHFVFYYIQFHFMIVATKRMKVEANAIKQIVGNATILFQWKAKTDIEKLMEEVENEPKMVIGQ